MKKKEKIDIENIFCPDNNVLKKEGEYYIMEMVDVELDTLNCSFCFDHSVEICTKDFSYIKLSRENLIRLLNALEETEDILLEELKKGDFN